MSGLSFARAARLFALGLYLVFGTLYSGYLTALVERSGHGAAELLHFSDESRTGTGAEDSAGTSAKSGDGPRIEAAGGSTLRLRPLLDGGHDAATVAAAAGTVLLLAVGILFGPLPAPAATWRAFRPDALPALGRWHRTVVLLI